MPYKSLSKNADQSQIQSLESKLKILVTKSN